MSKRGKHSIFGMTLTLVVAVFVLLGTVRILLPEATGELPRGIQEAADLSASLLRKLGETIHPVEAKDVKTWNLTLVNRDNGVPEDWESEFTELRNGNKVDSRIYPYLQEMFDDCRAAGLAPEVYSGYRSRELQQELFENKIQQYMDEGKSEDSARKLAERWVAPPGFSEHELGLAVDVRSEDTDICSDEEVYAWLAEHCQDYGFILRYEEDTVEITGIQYEPWHFRYVGVGAAQEIMTQGITLEEYLLGSKVTDSPQ